MRPRQFDETEVLRIAFDRFRRQGVHATSLADIAREAGTQRGSLYHAYGSKETLFLTAYQRYAQDYLATLAAALATGTLQQRLEAFFAAVIANFHAGIPPRGCPTTRGLMEVGTAGAGLDEAARAAFAGLLRDVAALVEAALRDGAGHGEFAGDPVRGAWHLVTIARGLVVIERAFGDEAQLRAIARDAVATLLSASPGPEYVRR